MRRAEMCFNDSVAAGDDVIGEPGPRGGLSWWVWLVAGVQVAVLLATSTRYGFHRDELYFIVAGSHPAAGYPDQPPLVPLLSHAMYSLDPGTPFLLRLPSALAAAATTLVRPCLRCGR